jgi:hypothetical protein
MFQGELAAWGLGGPELWSDRLARSPLNRKLTCTVAGAELEGGRVRVRFAPLRGKHEIIDWIQFEPRGEPRAMNDVGRFLRILRAGRIRPPDDPYALGANPAQAAELLARCTGTALIVHVRTRIERTLTVWTEGSVETFERILDLDEQPDALLVRRTGGRSALRIPRDTVIRYDLKSDEQLEVTAVESK